MPYPGPNTIQILEDFTVQEGESYTSNDGTQVFWFAHGGFTFTLLNLGYVGAFNSSGDPLNGDASAFTGVRGVLINRGTVEVVATGGWAWGYNETDGHGPMTIVNDGLWSVRSDQLALGVGAGTLDVHITNNGDWIVSGGFEADGMFLVHEATVINNGTISVSATGDAYGLWLTDIDDGTITNTGDIIVSGGGDCIGILVSGLAIPTPTPNIINSGTITADIAILAYNAGWSPPQDKVEFLFNTGTINGLIDLGLGNDIIDNESAINGDVYMFSGNDLVDTTLGVINGAVFLEEGNDHFLGGAQGQLVFGGAGEDLLVGGSGDDVLDGGPGPDTINGGAGFDLASYESATAPVTVSLLAQGVAQNTGGGGSDTLTGVEGLAGSAFNDVLTGDAGGNNLFGLAGDDTLNGDPGTDTINGGAGFDLASYEDAITGITVSLLLQGGAQFISGFGNDTLISIEDLAGGSFNDTLIGDANGNFLFGFTGNDSLIGNAGDDGLVGGAGDDTLNGGAGLDLAVYEDAASGVTISLLMQGAPQNTGGAGSDTLISIEDIAGSALGDTLTGDNNQNSLFGLAGDDTLFGNGGVDAAAYFLSSTSASWQRNVNGSWTVTSADGTDTLTAVEFLSFSDRDVFLDRAARTFSGNGTSDVLFRRSDGIMASWEVTGTTINAASFLPTAGAEWSVLGSGDVSGDGRDDVIWQRNDGLVYVWTMNGGAVSAAVALAGIGAEWSFLGVGDFNGDLVDDLAWQRNDGIVYTWTMQNTAIQSANNVTGLGAEWQIAGFGDFNGDGRDDFLWRNTSTGQTVFWYMNGTSIYSSGETAAQAGLDWSVVGVGDTNGDGRDDFLMQRASDGMIAVAMNGTTVSSAIDIAAANPAEWTVRGIGDYNGDGREDILWQNDNGLVYVWLMNGASILGSGALSGIGDDWSII